jgi:hypothetical protein
VVEQDTEEVFEARRELAKLRIERITIERDGDDKAKVKLTCPVRSARRYAGGDPSCVCCTELWGVLKHARTEQRRRPATRSPSNGMPSSTTARIRDST